MDVEWCTHKIRRPGYYYLGSTWNDKIKMGIEIIERYIFSGRRLVCPQAREER